jgi:hypothetical protein
LDHGTDEDGDPGIGEAAALQLSSPDQENLAEIRAADYPGKRMMVCRNPVLEEERRRKREALLEGCVNPAFARNSKAEIEELQ